MFCPVLLQARLSPCALVEVLRARPVRTSRTILGREQYGQALTYDFLQILRRSL
jgi:hypothetical protein